MLRLKFKVQFCLLCDEQGHPQLTNMHIVVAVNESEPSLYEFDWMIENMLKESKNHKLSILTVVEPPVQAGYYYAASGGT